MCGHDVEQPVDVAGVRDPDGVADGYLVRAEFKELLRQFGYSGRGDRALERAAEGDREIGSDPEACAPCLGADVPRGGHRVGHALVEVALTERL